MSALFLLLAILPAQDSALVIGPVWRSPALGIELPRPFDDWVFAPATERGTTTVIFHPRGSSLADHLWGVLVITPWDGVPDLDPLADRRLAENWRATLGNSFTLHGRDSVRIDGATAVRLRLGGVIEGVLLDIDEYLVARGTDFILLQLRYPRGVNPDSVAAGYRRLLGGIRLRPVEQPVPAEAPGFAPRVDDNHVVFEIPMALRAITAGTLTAEVVSGPVRMMRYRRPAAGEMPLYAVGAFSTEDRRAGRLTLHIWRNTDRAVRAAAVTDSTLAVLARGWASYWKAFGPVPSAELTLVETDWPFTRGAPGILFVGNDASPAVLLRELARTWWGGYLRSVGPFASFVHDVLPAWAPVVAGATVAGDDEPMALERARRASDPARFREALRTLAANADQPDAITAFFTALGTQGVTLRRALFP